MSAGTIELLFGWACEVPRSASSVELFPQLLAAGKNGLQVRSTEMRLLVVIEVKIGVPTARAALHAELEQHRTWLGESPLCTLDTSGPPALFLTAEEGAELRAVSLAKGSANDGGTFGPLCGQNQTLMLELAEGASIPEDEEAWSVRADQLEAAGQLGRANAVRMLNRRSCDPRQCIQAPSIHSHPSVGEGPALVGHRVDKTRNGRFNSRLVEVFLRREDDELVEALLQCQGLSQAHYGLVPHPVDRKEAREAFQRFLSERVRSPSGDFDEDLRALCARELSGAERWTTWRGSFESLSKAELLRVGETLAKAWGTPPLEDLQGVRDGLLLQVMQANFQAQVRENLWQSPPPATSAQVADWEKAKSIRLPWLLRSFWTTICGGIGDRWSQQIGGFIGHQKPKTFEAHLSRVRDETDRLLLFNAVTEASESDGTVELEREVIREDTSVARTMVLLSFWSDTHDDEGCFLITRGPRAGRVMWIVDLFEGGGTATLGGSLGSWLARVYGSGLEGHYGTNGWSDEVG